MDTCQHCEKPLEQPKTGRRRKFCDDRCKVAAWKARKTHEVAACDENSPSVDTDHEEVDLNALSDEELREVATNLGLPTSGDREELTEIIFDAFAEDDNETHSNESDNATKSVVVLRKWQLSPEEIEAQKRPSRTPIRRWVRSYEPRAFRGGW